ncbi:lytic transglycosylase domain-containing protein [Kribbella sp. NBC_00359]|uniref:lytic transglycosylase domain-containing protein n=1 Tax=Kribbella sp. NBC_00359 TaxID=2975966 RepID=UPI002E204180
MRVPGLHNLIKRPGRDRGRHRRGRPAVQNHWQVAGSIAAVVTLAALATAQLPDRPASGGYAAAGGYDAAGAAQASAADPFIDDEVLDEFVTPEQLVAVPVGPGRVAKPVQMVLSGAPVIRTLGESGIPDVAVRAYKKAEARLAVSDPGCGVPWTLLAAIGRVESNHGRFGGAQLRDDGSATRRIRGIPLDGRPNVALIRDSDGGALDGDTVYDRAVGPMQFIPSTWRAVNADANGDGFADPNNIFDAAQGAAQYLCTGTSNLRDPARAAQAVRRYNNADSYVRLVLALAQTYQAGRVIGLPSTGELLPDEPNNPPALHRWPTDNPPALRPWPTDAPPADRSWPTNPPPALPSWPPDAPPAVGSGPTDAPPGDTVLAKPAPTQRTEPVAPPRAVTRPRTTAPAPNPVVPRPSKPVAPKPAPTTTAPAINPKPSEPAQTQPTKPKPSQPTVSEPQPSEPTQPPKPKPSEPRTTDPQPTAPRPSAPKPSEPRPSAPKPSEPRVTEPQPSEPQASEPEPTPSPRPEPSEPKPSEPRASEPSESGSPTPAPSAEPTPERKPTTAAVGWAPAMRQVVGRALARPACPQPQTAQPDKHSKACPADSAKPSPARDDKNRERCTPQHTCKIPSSPRPSAGPGPGR